MKLFLVLVMTCLVYACSETETVDATQADVPKMPALLDTQMDALEKAQSVEQSLQEMKKERDDEMRKQGI